MWPILRRIVAIPQMGVAQSVPFDAQQHLEAVKRYPELAADDVT